MEPCGGLARAWPAALFLSFVNKAARGPPLQWTSVQSLPFLGPFLVEPMGLALVVTKLKSTQLFVSEHGTGHILFTNLFKIC